MTPRFYGPDAERPGDLVGLPEEEAAHLTRVLRLGAGAVVRVFNGRGSEFEAVVEAARRGRVHLRLGAARAPAPEPRVAVTLAQAVLKGDRMDQVVRDGVMMGVAAVQPMVTARTEVGLATLRRSRRRERWARIAVSSAKQCGRATVPPILEPRLFAEVAAALAHMSLPGPGLMLVEPSFADGAQPLAELDVAPPRETTIVIGPEGGWDAAEIERAAAACRLVTLGGRTLRADVMGLVALAALYAAWREF
ncbi:MAG: hypothetical protein A3I61_14185 [Acidobacteria bacterium RIFCSPLOWO2_02_FULL_68_18]|nr:MAG: hypothetical protein A3I61_14185 [Acidobacteria bacterium RIFCSPLOWO2_02_FULL_68_18]OFW50001.1 MAG: hypothetical protein A3G77_08775 [Acidobacteria bacterium RIFCSPLOWO2_12_FULL_68_19]